jgi:polyisoprenoid-binding protein YceI
MRKGTDRGGMTAKVILLFCSLSALSTRSDSAEAPKTAHALSVDKASSEIRFVVKSKFKPIEGTFENWTAEVQLESTKVDSLNLLVTAQAASVKTGNFLEESLIRGENFFASEKYPELRLVSKKIDVASPATYRMEAELTLRGTSHPVLVPFTLTFDDAGGGKLKGECEFNRKDFGITYNMALNPIEDLVKVLVTLTIIPGKAETAPNPTKK